MHEARSDVVVAGLIVIPAVLVLAFPARSSAQVSATRDRVGVHHVRAVEPGGAPGPTGGTTRPASAGGTSARAVDLPGALGRLVLRDTLGRETDPLEIRELRVGVRILGAVALTEIEQTFFNPTDRRAEGVFYFPLPAGASLSRFAMYVDDRLVEGELVERARARRVYEEIVRRMQDPALMEWQEGNVFKTRIFPIPPKGPKRILISYTQLLRAADGERRYVYPLVSKTTQAAKIGRFELDVAVSGLDLDRHLSAPGYSGAAITREGEAVRVRLVREDFRPVHDFVLRFAPARGGTLEMATDRRKGEDGFFMVSCAPPFDIPSSAPERDGRDVVLMVDTSLSRRADDYRAQLVCARTLLSELGPDDRFAAISFDAAPRLHQGQFVAGAAEADALVSALEKIVPLGATDLGTAFETLDSFLKKNAPRGRPDVILLGDGIATLGETAPEKLTAKVAPMLERHGVRFHAVAMGARHDRLVLEELARRTGGLFRVMSPGDDVQREAFRLVLALDSALLPAPEVEFSGVEVCEVYPARAGTLVAGEEMIVLGRYEAAGTLKVAVKREGLPEMSSTFELPETVSRNVFVPRLWARERLDALMLRPQTAETVKDIVELSQEFTLITPYTSFLVLENEEAYRKYGIDRRRRRRYWEEMGKLRTAPPREERPPEMPRREPDDEDKPFTLADLDLAALSPHPANARALSTALASMCLQVYYRYLPMDRGDGGVEPLPRAEVTREPVAPPFQPVELETPAENLVGDVDWPQFRGDWEEGPRDSVGGEPFESPLVGGGNWLARHQRADGSWGGVEETGLAVLSFLGAGYTQRVGRYKRTVSGGLAWLMARQKADGQIGSGAYEHAVAALALCETFGMTRDEKVGKTAQRAIYRLVELQEPYSGWGERTGKCHPLVTIWAVMALKSAKVATLRVPGSAFQGAINYLDEITDSDGAVGTNGKPKAGEVHLLHTAGAMLARQFMGWDRSDPIMVKQGSLLLHLAVGKEEMPPDGLYLHFIGTLAMFRMGGEWWKRWQEWRDEVLLPLQVEGGEDDGSWPPVGVRVTGRRPRPDKKLSEEEVAEGISAALEGFKEAPRARQACEALAAALSCSKDMKTLTGALAGAAGAPSDARAMVRLRLGMVHYGERRFDDAAAEFRAAYETAGRPENALALYVQALRRGERAREALELLLSEANEGRTSPWRRHEAARLLFDRASGVKDPVAFVNERLTGEHAGLKAAFGRAAGKEHPRTSVAFFARAYAERGRDGRYTAAYVGSLRAAGRAREAFELLLREAREDGRIEPWRMRAVAQALLESKVVTAAERYADEAFARHPRARAALKMKLTPAAREAGDSALLARLYEDAFYAGGRRADLVQPYVDALLKAGRRGKACGELESAIRAGYHTAWAFQSLAGAYEKLRRGDADVLRAVSSEVETFPRDVLPRIRLARCFERLGEMEAALGQYREAARIRPEDPDLHRQVVERALALGRYRLARETLREMFTRWPNRTDFWGPEDGDLLDLLRKHAGPIEGTDLERLIRRHLVKDLVVIMTWDKRGTDIDLRVTEPGGEECHYQHMKTASGGVLDDDDTDGPGRETYAIRRAKPGKYRVDVVYYKGTPRTVVTVGIYRDRGGEDETVATHEVELTKAEERVTVATVEVPPAR